MAKNTAIKKPSADGVTVTSPIGTKVIRAVKKTQLFILFALYQFANNGLVSGRTGGDVKMRNGRSRGMKVPALVRNVNTTLARAILASVSSLWATLTPEQVVAWNSYKVTSSDRFGVMHIYGGKTAFVRLNCNLTNIATSVILDPPVGAVSPIAIEIVHLIVDSTTSTMTVTTAATPLGYAKVFATAPLPANVSRPAKSAFRFFTIFDSSVGGTYDFTTAYIARFGLPPVGSRVFLQLVNVSDFSGVASAVTQDTTIAI